MHFQNQSILFLSTVLTHITIKFLLFNTTAHLQSCNAGIINSFKV